MIVGLIAVIASLFSALYFLYRDRGHGERMVKRTFEPGFRIERVGGDVRRLTISGELQPFEFDHYTDIGLNFENIALPIFNPYSGKFAGFAIASGKLSTELHYLIQDRSLKADHKIRIEQLEWGEATAAKGEATLPVKFATWLLKDSHGVIDLNVPVTGSLDDPKFRIGPIIWQVIKNLASNTDKLETVIPKEGSTGWSDTWMVSSKAAHPNCMYMWMEYITSPEVQAQVAYYFGEAPANPKACPEINTLYKDATHCDVFKATDEAFAKSIAFWATPRKECLDGKGSDCVPFVDWIKAWTEIKG